MLTQDVLKQFEAKQYKCACHLQDGRSSGRWQVGPGL